MKTKDFIIYSCVFLLSILGTAEIVTQQLTGDHLFTKAMTASRGFSGTRCSDKPIPERSTNDPQLLALPEYEQACQSAAFTQMMLFTNMPISEDDARAKANAMTGRLQAFSEQGITPIVIVEPDSEWGLVDFHEYSQGMYDGWNVAFFEQLKSNGLTDEQLGIWIPFPEPQQPFWNNNADPDDFAHSINRYFKVQKAAFPNSKSAILLDSQVGSENQKSQLLAYTRLVDNSLVDMAGLQGFPWNPPTPEDPREPVRSAEEFLPASLIKEVAQSLGTKDILLNTGTYRHMRMENGGQLAVTLEERSKTLDSIAEEVSKLRNDDFNVTVNIFAENKLSLKEGVDWSYWQAGNYRDSSTTALFTSFSRKLINDKVTLSFYDSRTPQKP